MVRITRIETVRSMVYLFLDSGEKTRITRKEYLETQWTEGVDYSDDLFFRTIRLFQYPRALNQAVSMLSRRPCSTEEIRRRLQQYDYLSEVTDLVLYKLKKEKLLDDKTFCEQWIQYRTGQKYGPARILRELKFKGIPEDIAIEALSMLDMDVQEDHSLSLAVKAWLHIRKDDDLRRSRQKVILSLVRKGYGWDQAKAACSEAEKQLDIKTTR